MKIACIIEARMNSSRLPGKILKEIAGKPMLVHLIERLKQVNNSQEVIVATTSSKKDDITEQIVSKEGVFCYRGDEDNVTQRVIEAAEERDVDVIVQVTGDNPMIDPEIVEQVINMYIYNKFDYVSNDLERSYPIGMNTRVFSTKTLIKAFNILHTEYEKEHTTMSILKNKDMFTFCNLYAPKSLCWPNMHLTVDEENDFLLAKAIFEALYNKKYFSLLDIIDFLKDNPDLSELNKQVQRRF